MNQTPKAYKVHSMSFRVKLSLVSGVVVLAVVIFMTVMMNITAARQANRDNVATLELVTEQALANFVSQVNSADRGLHTHYMASGAPSIVMNLKGQTPGAAGFTQNEQELRGAFSRITGTDSLYQHVVMLYDDTHVLIGSEGDNTAISEKVEEFFSQEKYAQNTYGRSQWYRTKNGELWIIRDVYNAMPLKHLGKLAALIKQEELVPYLGNGIQYQGQMLFYDQENRLLTIVGDGQWTETEAWQVLNNKSGRVRLRGVWYYVTMRQQSRYTVAGILPMTVINAVQKSVNESMLFAAALGILLGVLMSWIVTHHMTRQIHTLVDSMNEVSAGNLDVILPVVSGDELGLLAENFNGMTKKTKELLQRLVEEEKNKQQAEYQNLEYQYRFLQWQINPHFIYNALEVVNAMAKIDGDEELSMMVIELSSYFRQNAHSMQRRSVTVREEFESLSHYAEIYRSIYGETYSVYFECLEDTEKAYLPTMILQPLLENALVHGRDAMGDAEIIVSASHEKDELMVVITDNGPGITDQAIQMLMNPKMEESKNHLGVRNAMERLHLLYGQRGTLKIYPAEFGGTTVEMRIPFSLEETLDLQRNAE